MLDVLTLVLLKQGVLGPDRLDNRIVTLVLLDPELRRLELLEQIVLRLEGIEYRILTLKLVSSGLVRLEL